ncbi:MAG: hypothetical protein IJB52_00930 [Clostridia bacterium]|nr:hypothetical protein [Clostridia bacterium]
MLYKDWLADWLTNYVKPSAKDKTCGRYSDIINHHLLPNLGEYELNDLTPIITQKSTCLSATIEQQSGKRVIC